MQYLLMDFWYPFVSFFCTPSQVYTSVMNTLVPRKEKGVNLRIKHQGWYYAGRVLREEKQIAPVQMGGGKRFGRMIWRKDQDWDSVIGCSLSWAPDTLRSKLRTRWAVAARMVMVRSEVTAESLSVCVIMSWSRTKAVMCGNQVFRVPRGQPMSCSIWERFWGGYKEGRT